MLGRHVLFQICQLFEAQRRLAVGAAKDERAVDPDLFEVFALNLILSDYCVEELEIIFTVHILFLSRLAMLFLVQWFFDQLIL